MQPRLTVCAVLVAAVVAASAAAASSSNEHFTLSDTTAAGVQARYQLTAAGPIRGSGTATDDSPNGNSRVDHIPFHLATGNVDLVGTEKSFVVHKNAAKCSGTNTGQGIWTITGGTGSYRTARGTGTYRRYTTILGARSSSGACMLNAPPKSVHDQQTLTGTVALA